MFTTWVPPRANYIASFISMSPTNKEKGVILGARVARLGNLLVGRGMFRQIRSR